MGSSFKIKLKAISFCFQKLFVLSVISTIYRMGQRNVLIYKINLKKVVRIFINSFEHYKLRSLNFLFSWFYQLDGVHYSLHSVYTALAKLGSFFALLLAYQRVCWRQLHKWCPSSEFFKVLGRSMNTIDLR